MKKTIALFFVLIFTILLPFYSAASYSTTPPDVASETYVVMDSSTGQVLVEKGMDQKMYPASLTKIMTVILALEKGDPDAMHTMSYEATHSIDADSTHIALTEGEQISLRDLMYATMIASANDAANGIAECIAGSMDAFVDLMNEKAKEIGAVNTHFTNANGLHDDDHYTTAYDLALITKYALGIKDFRTYWSAEEYTIAPTNKQEKERVLGTQHSMFVQSEFTYEGCNGGKLGYTDEARHTAATSAKRGDLELICITMSSKKYEKFTDTAALFDYCFDSFGQVTLSKHELQGFIVPIMSGEEKMGEVRIYPDNGINLVLHKDFTLADVNLEYNVPQEYQSTDTVAPTLHLRLNTDTPSMYSDLGEFPLQFTQTDLTAQAADAKTDLPRKDTTVFWKNVLSVLGWVGIGIGVLAGMVVLLVAFLIIRNYFYRKKRKRRRIHSLSDRTASHLARERMVHFYVQPDSENRGADTYRTNPRHRRDR